MHRRRRRQCPLRHGLAYSWNPPSSRIGRNQRKKEAQLSLRDYAITLSVEIWWNAAQMFHGLHLKRPATYECPSSLVQGHLRSLTLVPFDRRVWFPIRLKLCVYLVPFSRYGELFVEIRNFDLPHLHLLPRWGWPRSNFEKNGTGKLESLCYHAALFASSYVWPI